MQKVSIGKKTVKKYRTAHKKTDLERNFWQGCQNCLLHVQRSILFDEICLKISVFAGLCEKFSDFSKICCQDCPSCILRVQRNILGFQFLKLEHVHAELPNSGEKSLHTEGMVFLP